MQEYDRLKQLLREVYDCTVIWATDQLGDHQLRDIYFNAIHCDRSVSTCE